MAKPKLLVILGPTAVGKTGLGIDIAKKFGGEILSADSLQVYKYMDIGTAKPSREEQTAVRHHMIDVVRPDEEFNAGRFRAEAARVIDDLHASSRNIIVVGGTYLYVKVLLSGLIRGLPADREIRADLKKLGSEFGRRYVYDRLLSVDPESASKIHPNDYVRIERALEVYYLTGQKMSDLQSDHEFGEHDYEYVKIGILHDRDLLRDRIDERVDGMFEKGLVDEVRGLREMGYDPSLKPMQSIGYKEVNLYLDKELELESAVGLIKRDTKRFAKRQMTWLRRDDSIQWFDTSTEYDALMNKVRVFFDDA